MVNNITENSFQYDAFISYSRHDKVFAGALEKALENYKAPKELATFRRSPNVFRDEGDLTGTEYFHSIDEHLKNSTKLIVVCSPRARESLYVNDEIRRFVSARGADNIIPVLLEGIPNNEAQPEQEDEMAFPEALVDVMELPLATDYRGFNSARDKVRKGSFEASWYMLLANLYEVSRAEMEQRDRKRQARRRNITGAVAVSVMLALLVLAIWALNERKLAISRQLEAERQTRISTARNLASESASVRQEFSQRSLLLAVEAIKATSLDKTHVPVAEQRFRDALDSFSGRGLSGHTNDVLALAFSRDKRWLVSGSADQTARLWDLTATGPIGSSILLSGHDEAVSNVVFSYNSRWLVTASGIMNRGILREGDYEVRLWDLTSKNIATSAIVLHGNKMPIISVAMSPDGQWLATADYDSQILIWDLSVPGSIPGPIALRGQRVKFSGDNHWLITGSPYSIELWDLSSSNRFESPAYSLGYRTRMKAIGIGPAGRWLASADSDGNIRLCDLTSKDPTEASMILSVPRLEIGDLTVSSDKRWLVTKDADGTAQLWDLLDADPSEGPIVLEGHQRSVGAMAISPDNRWVATATTGGFGEGEKASLLWELTADDLATFSTALVGHEGPVSALAFSQDGHWVATGSYDTTVRLWDLYTHEPTTGTVRTLEHEKGISAAAASPDNHFLITSGGKTVAFWDLTSNGPSRGPRVLKSNEQFGGKVAMSPDKRWLVTLSGFKNTKVNLLDLTSEDPVASTTVLHKHEEEVKDLVFSPDGHWLVTASFENVARLWDLTTDGPGHSPLVLREHSGPVTSTDFSPDSKWLVTGSDDKTARLWDLTADDPSNNSIVLKGHRGRVSHLVFSDDNHWLATGSRDHTVRLWDMTADDPSKTSTLLTGHEDQIFAMVITPNSHWLATASFDRTVRLWDLTATGPAEGPIVLRGHEGAINTMAASPDNRWLATGSNDETVRLWDLTAPDPAQKAPIVFYTDLGGVADVIIIGNWLIARGRSWITEGQKVQLWPLSIEELLLLASKRAGRNLSRSEWKRYFPGEPYRKTFAEFVEGR